MNLLKPLSWPRPGASIRPLDAATAAELEVSRYVEATQAADPAPGPSEPAGCGWFDSSFDLQSGLLVTEHASADAVAADLPLQAWLELHLTGWQPDWRAVQ